ncbi:MAG: exopolysaccharide biosynthesis protein [Granulosicoccus sp.]|nr:exopolysaccharide biosynthesis protein [Granulosicoccus sp.]
MASIDPTPSKSTPHNSEDATSLLVQRWLREQKSSSCSLDALFQLLEQRSYGGIIIVLALIGLLPGISVAAGIAIIVIAVQMLLEFHAPRLPNFVTRREINREKLMKTLTLPVRWLSYAEKFIKPRWPFMSNRLARKFCAVVMILLAIFMITPLPLSNMLPAIALLFIALGLLENDGAMLLIGFATSVIALVIGMTMIGVLYGLIVRYFTG